MRFLFALPCLWILPGAVAALVEGLTRVCSNGRLWPYALGGAVIGVLLGRSTRAWLYPAGVFIHELKHAVAAVLLGREILEFDTTPDKGHVRHTDGPGGQLGDHLITLSPYCLPLLTIFALLPRPWIPEEYLCWHNLWLATSITAHLVIVLLEARANIRYHRWQSKLKLQNPKLQDIPHTGFVFSAIVLTTVNCIAVGFVLFILNDHRRAFADWLHVTLPSSRATYEHVLAFARETADTVHDAIRRN